MSFTLRRTVLPALAGLCFGVGAVSTEAAARAIKIVALGDSNFGAPRVAPSEAYPAQLERALRARGFDVSVKNAGINGDTTMGVLRRMNSDVPQDTDIVLLSIGINDIRVHNDSPENTRARVSQIAGQLKARGIQVIDLGSGKVFQGSIADRCDYHVECSAPGQTGPVPGTTRWHLNPAGYGVVVNRTLPQVIDAIRKAQKKSAPTG